MTYATSIPKTVVGTDIPTKLVGTVYFDKSCILHTMDNCVILFYLQIFIVVNVFDIWQEWGGALQLVHDG